VTTRTIALPPYYSHSHAIGLFRLTNEGFFSVRYTAGLLGWTPDEVQICMWGEVRQ
jgi:hypothetical protein